MDGKLAELRAHLDKETKARKDLEEKITHIDEREMQRAGEAEEQNKKDIEVDRNGNERLLL